MQQQQQLAYAVVLRLSGRRCSCWRWLVLSSVRMHCARVASKQGVRKQLQLPTVTGLHDAIMARIRPNVEWGCHCGWASLRPYLPLRVGCGATMSAWSVGLAVVSKVPWNPSPACTATQHSGRFDQRVPYCPTLLGTQHHRDLT